MLKRSFPNPGLGHSLQSTCKSSLKPRTGHAIQVNSKQGLKPAVPRWFKYVLDVCGMFFRVVFGGLPIRGDPSLHVLEGLAGCCAHCGGTHRSCRVAPAVAVPPPGPRALRNRVARWVGGGGNRKGVSNIPRRSQLMFRALGPSRALAGPRAGLGGGGLRLVAT